MESTTWFLITIVISLIAGVVIGWWIGGTGKKQLRQLKDEAEDQLQQLRDSIKDKL